MFTQGTSRVLGNWAKEGLIAQRPDEHDKESNPEDDVEVLPLALHFALSYVSKLGQFTLSCSVAGSLRQPPGTLPGDPLRERAPGQEAFSNLTALTFPPGRWKRLSPPFLTETRKID